MKTMLAPLNQQPKVPRRIRQLERTLGRKSLEIEILKNVVGE